jgi:predicted enzyme related to lactoylglutathione lyase
MAKKKKSAKKPTPKRVKKSSRPAASRAKASASAKSKPAKKQAPKKAAGRSSSSARSKPRQTLEPKTPTIPVPGSFVWHELATTDTGRARDFYSQLFGWKSSEVEMGPGFTYTTFKHGGKDAAGMFTMAGPDWEGKPPHWMVYIGVDDVDAMASKAQRLGGTVCVPPTDIPVGRFAVLQDPTGAAISIYKSNA